DDLLRQPFGRRMSGHREPNQLAATVTHDYKCKQALKRHRVNQAKIDRCDRVRMVAQERSPGLRRWPAVADHILGDRRLGDFEPKLEQFAVNAGRTPELVLSAHPPNEFAQLAIDLGTSQPTARLPTPVCSKPCSMPAHDRVWPNNARQTEEGWPAPCDPDHECSISAAQPPTLRSLPYRDIELIA